MLGVGAVNGALRATHPLIARLDAGDRAMFLRLSTGARRGTAAPRVWRILTHLGGATATVTITLGCALLGKGAWGMGGRSALMILVVSHLMVQVIKRSVGRPRPSAGLPVAALIAAPDRFSFPSGHAAAVASVALGLGLALPELAPWLGAAAVLVGFSRVAVGVHYPGDVLAGQALALVAAWLLRSV
jgi:undecaprenyl-diphosphatase